MYSSNRKVTSVTKQSLLLCVKWTDLAAAAIGGGAGLLSVTKLIKLPLATSIIRDLKRINLSRKYHPNGLGFSENDIPATRMVNQGGVKRSHRFAFTF